MSGVPMRLIADPIYKFRNERDADGFRYRRDLQAGDAHWNHYEDGSHALSYVCPCGCGMASMISVHTGETGHGWHWNGDEEKPTLAPSIQQLNKCRWHGHLTAGVWVPC